MEGQASTSPTATRTVTYVCGLPSRFGRSLTPLIFTIRLPGRCQRDAPVQQTFVIRSVRSWQPWCNDSVLQSRQSRGVHVK